MKGVLLGLRPFLIAVPVLALLQWATADANFFVQLALLVGVNITLSVSLNIVNGMTGQFSIGHAGFMAVGAYLAGVVSKATSVYGISFLPEAVSDQVLYVVSLVVGGVAAGAFGFLVGLPSLRLKGDYLAIVTLGFGEIIRVVVQNTDLFGKALGLSGVPQHTSLFSCFFVVVVVVVVARRIHGSSHGRALLAIREDEIAAEAMGVNTTAYKVRAFVVASFFAGLAGGVFAHYQSIVAPSTFTYVKSMEIVVMVVAGGLGSTTGSVVAAVVLTLLPEALRTLFVTLNEKHVLESESIVQKVEQIRMPIYGLLLVVIMLVRPQGLFGTREIWELDLFKKKKQAPGAAGGPTTSTTAGGGAA